jgi:hypothetical protein
MVTVLVVGGRLRQRTLANVDDFAVQMVGELRVDVAFVATNGISERGCSTPDPAEAAVKRAMVGSADRVVLLADHAKFGQEHFVDRPGRVHVRLDGGLGVGGRAVTALDGNLVVPEADDDEIIEA